MTSILKLPVPLKIDFADCILSRQSLTINSAAGFEAAGSALISIDSCSQWLWGDYLCYAETHGLKSVLDMAHADLHRSTIYSYKECTRFYLPADRHPDLTFGHHLAIMYCLGVDATAAEAREWLAIAAKEELSVGAVREKIRTAKRQDENDPGPMRGVVRITDFVKVSRWSATVKVADLEPQEAEEIRQSTGSLFTFLCELHRKPFSSP